MATKITIEIDKKEVTKKGNKVLIEIPASQLKDILKDEVKLSTIAVGDTFKINGYEWIVLDHDNDSGSTEVILKDLLPYGKFDSKSNNWANSDIKEYLNNEFIEEIGIDKDFIFLHRVDLTSDDGLKDYGEDTCLVSMLTCDMYRQYVTILDKYKIDDWWWLVTPYSTPTHGYSNLVRIVNSNGALSNFDYNDNCVGVRPFLILKSCTLVER